MCTFSSSMEWIGIRSELFMLDKSKSCLMARSLKFRLQMQRVVQHIIVRLKFSVDSNCRFELLAWTDDNPLCLFIFMQKERWRTSVKSSMSIGLWIFSLSHWPASFLGSLYADCTWGTDPKHNKGPMQCWFIRRDFQSWKGCFSPWDRHKKSKETSEICRRFKGITAANPCILCWKYAR